MGWRKTSRKKTGKDWKKAVAVNENPDIDLLLLCLLTGNMKTAEPGRQTKAEGRKNDGHCVVSVFQRKGF